MFVLWLIVAAILIVGCWFLYEGNRPLGCPGEASARLGMLGMGVVVLAVGIAGAIILFLLS